MAKKIAETSKIFKREEPSGSDVIKLWFERIENTLVWLKDKHWNGWPSWKAAYELDRTIHWASKKLEQDQNISSSSEDLGPITIPLIANHIRNLIPFLMFRDPHFFGRPKKEDFSSIIAQMDYLNAVWREHKMTKQARRTILDAAIIGHGIAKSGWTIKLELPDNIEKKGILDYKDYIKEESPWIRRINPFLFVFDRFGSDYDLDSARWCAELIIKPLQDVIDNENYDESLRKKLEDGSITPLSVEEFSKNYYDSANNQSDFLFSNDKNKTEESALSSSTLILLYEVWDKKFNKTYTLLAGDGDQREKALRERTNPYDYLGSFPYEKVDFEEVPNNPYGIGHARYLSDTQKMVNRNRNKIYSITRMFNPKWAHIGDEPLGIIEENKLKEDIPGVVINLKPGSTLNALDTPKASQDLYNAANLLDKDFTELSGQDILSRGGLLPSRTSAEEIRERSRLRGLRLETNVQNTNEFVLSLAKQILKHAKNNLKVEKAVSVIGRPGSLFNEISPKQFESEVTLDMGVISKSLDPPEVQRSQIMKIFQMVSNPNMIQLFQQFQIPVNLSALWYKLLELMDIPEMQVAFPGLSGFREGLIETIPETFTPLNTASAPNIQPGSPEGSAESTRQIQSDNISPQSLTQGLEGLLNAPGGGEGEF